MRIFIVTVGTLFVFFIGLLTVKYWGKAQIYTPYRHAMLSQQEHMLEFIEPTQGNLVSLLGGNNNLCLNIGVTSDQLMVVVPQDIKFQGKPLKAHTYEEVKDRVLLLKDLRESLGRRKIIFNITDNVIAVQHIFLHNMRELGLEKGENFLVMSPSEAPMKALKEEAPALIYGPTQPEILKLKAMQSMYLIEAVSLRADVLVHSLKIRGKDFFDEELLAEMNRRQMKIIVGPISRSELAEAQRLNAYGVILKD